MTSKILHSRTISAEANTIPVSIDNILKSLQVPIDKADPYVVKQIKLYREKSWKLSKPCASYTIYGKPHFDTESSELFINNNSFALGKIVAHALKKSSSVAFFVCTCGESVEHFSKELIKGGHTLEGYIVDLIGSEIAEGMADFIHKEIGNDMKKKNLNITNRYSPGYCNWPVSDQQFLFPMMKNTCGVALTLSSLMIPIKSVSGIVGIGPDVKFRGYSCSKCDAGFCIYRDKK